MSKELKNKMADKNNFAVIFDMDGVLLDSTKHIWASFNKLVEPHNIKFDNKEIKKYLGNSLRDQMSAWKKDYGIDFGDPLEFSKKAHRLQMASMRDVKADEDLVKLLKELRKREIPLGVGT